MRTKEVVINKACVGQEFSDFLKEHLDANELEMINAKTDFLLQLINLRKEAQLTQKELGEIVGLKQSTIAKIEKGTISISFNNLFRILSALGKTIKITSL